MIPYRRSCRICVFVGVVLMLIWTPLPGLAVDFSMQWKPNSVSDQVQGYNVYYREGNSMAGDPANADQKVEIPTSTIGFDVDNPSHVLSGLKADTLYYFAISAYNAGGEGNLSDEVSLSKSENSSGSGSPPGASNGSGGGGCFIAALE